MKIAIVGRDSHITRHYKVLLKKAGFTYSRKNPSIVISLGGDGTLLLAERWYPGVPKLPIREKSICVNCDWDSLHGLIHKIRAKRFKIEKKIKVEARTKGKRIIALNEITLRNASQIHAIRFTVDVDGEYVGDILIGDGVIVSTPFGSTGYFYSVSRKKFKKGLGLAFNNLTKRTPTRNVSEKSKVRIKLVRGIALLSYDNDPKVLRLHVGDEIRIKKAKEVARVIKIR